MADLVSIELTDDASAAELCSRLAAVKIALPTHVRARILTTAADAVEREADALARLLLAEVRKPIKDARREVARSVFNLRWTSEECRRMTGEILPLDLDEQTEDRYALVKRVARGPALLITPFNFPLNLAVHKVAPAIAAGAPFILKPDPRAVKTTKRFLELIIGAGWPAEAAILAQGPIPAVEAIARDPRIKILSFTGSTKAGWRLKTLASRAHVVLELGGNAGVFVGADADLPWAAARCAWGAFSSAGQSCISVQRIFVERSVHEEFRRLLVQNIKELKVGEPNDESTDVGPMIDEAAARRVEGWLQSAVAAGAKLWAGGPRRGALLPPALIEGVAHTHELACQEIFGPVAILEAVDSRETALDLINGAEYGLQAGVFTNDIKFAHRAFDRLDVGGLIINEVPTYRSDVMPYGGVKESGIGREGARYAIEEFTQRRTLVMKP